MAKPEKKPHPEVKVASELHTLAVAYRHWLTSGKVPAPMTKAELKRRVTLLNAAATLLRKV